MSVGWILALFVTFAFRTFQLFLDVLALSLELDLHHLSFEVVWILYGNQVVLLWIKLSVYFHGNLEVHM